MSPIKGIFFDAAGVFYDRTMTTGTFARKLLRELGYPSELGEEDKARLKVLRSQATEGRIGHEAYWDQFLQMHQVADSKQRAALTKRILQHANQVLAHPGGKAAMAGLKQRGFIFGIVTDTIYPVEWKMDWLAQVGVAEFIDVVACSTALGIHKPDPRIYLYAVRRAQLTLSEAAFVGHDAGELAGARRAGLATVAVNYDPHAQADYYAQSLFDLLNVPIFQVAPMGVKA